jgi:flagellar FliL protein
MKLPGRMLIVILALALGAVGGGGFLFVLSGMGQSKPAAAEKASAKAPATSAPAAEEHQPGALFVLKDRVVNLADTNGRRYLKIGITLEVESEEDVTKIKGEKLKEFQKEIQAKLARFEPALYDVLVRTLSAKTFDEVASPGGKDKIKAELKEKFSHVMHEPRILNVYITDFIVQ